MGSVTANANKLSDGLVLQKVTAIMAGYWQACHTMSHCMPDIVLHVMHSGGLHSDVRHRVDLHVRPCCMSHTAEAFLRFYACISV